MLAVNSTEAWWTLADITNEGVSPVGLTDLTCSSVVAGVWMARACVEKEEHSVKKSVLCYYNSETLIMGCIFYFLIYCVYKNSVLGNRFSPV